MDYISDINYIFLFYDHYIRLINIFVILLSDNHCIKLIFIILFCHLINV